MMSTSTALAPVGAVRTDAVAANAHEEQYVTFTVGAEEYGVNILSVREIRGWTQESRLPNLPDFVRGVINLRGIIIPIFDLRARFGGGQTEVTPRHVVVVIQVGERTRGILVDAISDILAIGNAEIKPPPDVDAGLYTAEQRMVTLLNVEHLFAVEATDAEPAGVKALEAH
jgi:purine-binding chemotaxis protein CheW